MSLEVVPYERSVGDTCFLVREAATREPLVIDGQLILFTDRNLADAWVGGYEAAREVGRRLLEEAFTSGMAP